MNLDIISEFASRNILVVGDLMIDEYLWGETDRISPEAPVQVVSIQNEDFALGGAGNVINNIVSLGAKVSAAGVIGVGKNGQFLRQKLLELGVDTGGVVQEANRPTTQKTRVIASNQHVLRIDRETHKAISKSTLEKITHFIEAKIPEVDVVLVSDYGKGLITPPLLSRLMIAAQKHKKITVVDPKGLDFTRYSGASLLTPNKKEAALASGIEIVDEATLVQVGKKILDTVRLDKLLITCGKDGMVLFQKDKAPYTVRAEARQVYDVSGAGDTVLAVLGVALAAGASFENSVALANTAAGIVVGKVGTATVSPQELSAALAPYEAGIALKHKRLSDMPALIKELKKRNQRIVLTNGCFDLLHVGHIMLFAASKQQGDTLIVAIDDDDSVRTLKGPGRPVIRARERVRILSALDSVDYVVVFASKDLNKLIEIIQPDVLTKGSNYASEDVLGRKRVEELGGRIELIPITENISSTRIIHHIKNSNASAER